MLQGVANFVPVAVPLFCFNVFLPNLKILFLSTTSARSQSVSLEIYFSIRFSNRFLSTNSNIRLILTRIFVTETDLYVIPTNRNQYFLSSSYHLFYCKKGIPYSLALRLNRICSNIEIFNKRCNDLEKYVLEREYSEKMVRKEIL